jgi:hypothetical protein
MVSFFARHDGPLTAELQLLLERSIDASQNAATDELLRVIGGGDGFEGTRQVTADMQRLGLENTYISGLLDTFGAVLLPIPTPANSRSDLNTGPDPYNQTTAEDMGTMMVMIYQCSNGGGALFAAFPGRLTREECRLMIDYLSDNLVGPIFISGGSSPDGVVAHKHGWDALPLTNVADTALVFTPTGTYALTIYVHRNDTMLYEDANRFIISISRAVYNYFNWSGEPAGSPALYRAAPRRSIDQVGGARRFAVQSRRSAGAVFAALDQHQLVVAVLVAKLHGVHHLAHEVQAQAPNLHIFQAGVQRRLGDRIGVKGLGVVNDRDGQLAHTGRAGQVNIAAPFALVAMLDDVGAGFVHSQLAPADSHLVQPGLPAGLLNELGNLLQAVIAPGHSQAKFHPGAV